MVSKNQQTIVADAVVFLERGGCESGLGAQLHILIMVCVVWRVAEISSR
jgi:hypothetical protein